LTYIPTSLSVRWISYAVSAYTISTKNVHHTVLHIYIRAESFQTINVSTELCLYVAETAMGTSMYAQDERGSDYVKAVYEWVYI
jgi:hypothetical protein